MIKLKDILQIKNLDELISNLEEKKKKAKRDKCYYKVKSRYKVWPSAYASLALSACRGRKVKLGKPMRGDVKKFKVYVKNKKGNVVKVNFGHGGTSAKKAGQKTMRIRKSNPKARKSFRARHKCDTSPPGKLTARYWSCKKW